MTARPIAHRGLHDAASGIIENSYSAFEAAVDGEYAIECDLQVTSDGTAVVFHDTTLDRLATDASGKVKDHCADELAKLRLTGTSDRILRLEELLHQIDGKVPLILELKSLWDGDGRLAQFVSDCARGYAGPLATMSFDPQPIAQLREFSPDLVRGVVSDGTVDAEWQRLPLPERLRLRRFAHLDSTRPHFLSYDVRRLPSPASRWFRLAGKPVICWTVRSEQMLKHARHYCDQVTFEGFRP